MGFLLAPLQVQEDGTKAFVVAKCSEAAPQAWIDLLRGVGQVHRVLQADPVYFVQMGTQLYESAAGMVAEAEARGLSLGEIAIEYPRKYQIPTRR